MPRSAKPWFRESKNGWYATVGGRKVSLGVAGRRNGAAARAAFARLTAEASQRGATVGVVGGPPATVAAVVDAYLTCQEGRVKPETLRWLRRWLIPFRGKYGGRPAAAVAPHELEAFANRPGWKPNTRVHAVRTVHGAFRWAVKKRLLAVDPLAGVEAPAGESRGAEHVITPEEHRKLVAAAWPEFAHLLRALYLTGARPGELAGLTCEAVQAAGDVLVIADHKTKHRGKRRVLYLTDAAATFFREQAARWGTGPLFRNRYGRRWGATVIGQAMRATCDRAGVPRKHAYGYRHTFATDALEAGVPDAHVAELLGHEGTRTLHRHYAHLGAKAAALRAAAGKVRG
mgnify:CR=1 FL=1